MQARHNIFQINQRSIKIRDLSWSWSNVHRLIAWPKNSKGRMSKSDSWSKVATLRKLADLARNVEIMKLKLLTCNRSWTINSNWSTTNHHWTMHKKAIILFPIKSSLLWTRDLYQRILLNQLIKTMWSLTTITMASQFRYIMQTTNKTRSRTSLGWRMTQLWRTKASIWNWRNWPKTTSSKSWSTKKS